MINSWKKEIQIPTGSTNETHTYKIVFIRTVSTSMTCPGGNIYKMISGKFTVDPSFIVMTLYATNLGGLRTDEPKSGRRRS